MPPLSRSPSPFHQPSSHLWFCGRPYCPSLPSAPSCGSPCACGTESRVPALTCRRSRRGGGAGSGPRWVRGGWAGGGGRWGVGGCGAGWAGGGGAGESASDPLPIWVTPPPARKGVVSHPDLGSSPGSWSPDTSFWVARAGRCAWNTTQQRNSLTHPGPRTFQAI